MTDSECDEVFSQLESFLTTRGLSWVVDAVNSEIEDGLEQTRLVNTYVERISPDGQRSPLTQNRAVKSESYVEFTAPQKLRCLINAIEAVAVETTLMQQETLKTLGSVSEPIGQRVADQPMTVQFTSPNSGDAVYEFSQSEMEDRVKSASKLKDLLNALREEI